MVRRPLVVMALLFAVALAFASSHLHSLTQVRLVGEVNANWRGAYDILVRPANADLDLESTKGLVEPNFLGFAGSGGISLAQYAEIRGMQGVGLAAPVSVIGYLRTRTSAPTVHLSALPRTTGLYRVTVTTMSSDGVSPITVQASTGRILLHPGSLADLSLNLPSSMDASWDTTGLDLALPPLPEIVTPIIAVDPIAEAQLLGPSGAFLDPLTQVGTIEHGRSITVGAFPERLIPERFGAQSMQLDDLKSQAETAGRPVVPIVTSQRIYAPLTLTLHVQKLGHDLIRYPADATLDQLQTLAGSGVTDMGSASIDASQSIQPYVDTALHLTWPGSHPPSDEVYLTQDPQAFDARTAGRPTYVDRAPIRSGTPAFTIKPVGAVLIDGSSPVSAPPSTTRQQSYRAFSVQALNGGADFSSQVSGDAPYVMAPVGSFNLDRIRLPTNALDYVPLGAYDPPDTTLIANADGTAIRPTRLTTGLNPLGIVEQPPLAITDLVAATTLRGDDPIDAIRVRVGGIGAFSDTARDKIEAVASAIRSLGLRVDIVAGSSPQDVDIFVPKYHIAPDGRMSDLGWVKQQWTTLGAAAQVQSAIGSADAALLALGLGLVVLFAITTQLVNLDGRRNELRVLVQLGWSRRRISRWFLTESLVAGCFVLLFAGLGILAERGWDPAVGVGVLAALSFPIASVLALAVIWRPRRAAHTVAGSPALWRYRVVRTVTSYAGRSLLTQPLRSGLIILTLAVASSATLAGMRFIAASRTGAGHTLLASDAAAAIGPYQYSLVLLTALGAAALLTLLLRMDRSANAPDRSHLALSGWTNLDIRRATFIRATFLLAVASALTSILAIGAGHADTAAQVVIGVSLSLISCLSFITVASALQAAPWGRRLAR